MWGWETYTVPIADWNPYIRRGRSLLGRRSGAHARDGHRTRWDRGLWRGYGHRLREVRWRGFRRWNPYRCGDCYGVQHPLLWRVRDPRSCSAVIVIIVDLLHSCASLQVMVPSVDIFNFLPSRQALLEANPPTFLTSNVHQPLLSRPSRDTHSFGSSVLGLVSHLLDFRQGVLGFINLPLSLLQLNPSPAVTRFVTIHNRRIRSSTGRRISIRVMRVRSWRRDHENRLVIR